MVGKFQHLVATDNSEPYVFFCHPTNSEGTMRNYLPLAVVVSLGSLAACSKPAASTADSTTAVASTTASTTTTASADLTSNEGKIRNAMSAAPDSVASAAAIMDWPATAGGKPTQLRAGTNGWVCFPASPNPTGAVGQDPMCLDAEFQKWAGAWMTKKSPKLAAVGVAYMLQGDRGASITDPFVRTAAAAKKDEILTALNDQWTALAGSLPADVTAIQNRIDVLSKKSRKKQAAGIDLDAAKAGAGDATALWSKAQAAFAAGNMDEAVSTAKDVKVKVQALATSLKMDLTAPAA